MPDELSCLAFRPADAAGGFERVTAVCIGTGRFLRAVLVPTFVELGGQVILAQTRGKSFCHYMAKRPENTYEVDTVLQDGQVLTARFPVAACGTLGVVEHRNVFMELPAKLPNLRFVGLGLTEAGITHNGQSITDLAEFLHGCHKAALGSGASQHCVSIINTDNMPFNGDAIRNHVLSCDFTQNQSEAFKTWLQDRVCFHNTMVDRITSHRKNASEVPRAEPLPAKALVIEDLTGALPPQLGSVPGVVIRTQAKQLALDIALKLRIANGLHTAMVYAMSLGRLFSTDCCIDHPHILPYLEQLFERDIVHVCAELSIPRLQATPVFSEWMTRLQHPHFGLACLFVCQNAMQKIGIRLLPSVLATLTAGETPSQFMIFALAVVLRFLTPIGDQPRLGEHPPVFVGRLDKEQQSTDRAAADDVADKEYTSGLWLRPQRGVYDFRDGEGIVPLLLRPLGRQGGCSTAAAVSLAGEVLSRLEGFEMRRSPEHAQLAAAVGTMLQRMLTGESALSLLAELQPQQPLYLEERQVSEAVQQEVEAAEAVDMHTHLFTEGHGAGIQYGIDAMLTYHYLVAEFLKSSKEDAETFYKRPQVQQAEQVWQGLFIQASPLSEPCRGVLTTLNALGLRKEVAKRDLQAIRRWYAGQDANMFNEKMMRLARLRYVITSHDPFDELEAAACLEPIPPQPRYQRALALDKLVEGDWASVLRSLASASEAKTLQGVFKLLKRCISAVRPLFLTAATPHNFVYAQDEDLEIQISGFSFPAQKRRRLIPADEPLDAACPPSPQLVLDVVILPLCREYGLPLSLRMGTRRAVNPALGLAGDGAGPARLEALACLCRLNPSIKFLVTVLSRTDQHEASVLAGKFCNLHLWGCWWFCNNPSIVSDVTAMRMEMLGTGFTYQTSSARVHDQLIYKWIHARALLARLLTGKYLELMSTGWSVSRNDIRRDVHRLLGGAFEEFIAKPV